MHKDQFELPTPRSFVRDYKVIAAYIEHTLKKEGFTSVRATSNFLGDIKITYSNRDWDDGLLRSTQNLMARFSKVFKEANRTPLSPRASIHCKLQPAISTEAMIENLRHWDADGVDVAQRSLVQSKGAWSL